MDPSRAASRTRLHQLCDQVPTSACDNKISQLRSSRNRDGPERYAKGETMAELVRDYECGEATIWRALQ
jgi:hypothetical protein